MLKKYLERHRTRKFGKRMPDEKMTARILDAVQRKVTYPKSELMKMHGHNPWEALMHNFSQVNSEMHLLRKPVISRIATKNALDAAGVSIKYDVKQRGAVHKIMAGVVEKSERLVRAIGAENIGVESQITLVNNAYRELEKVLGKKAAKEFIMAYTEKANVLFGLARNLPVRLK